MTDLTFGSEVSHQELDCAVWEDIYIIGDVHGCFDQLVLLLKALNVTYSDLVVFTGDLVRKGPASKSVVDLVRATPNFFSVRGNNEDKVYKKKKKKRAWVKKSGLTESDCEWLLSLPEVITFKDSIVVHGGINPQKEFSEQSVWELQQIRSLQDKEGAYWYEEYKGENIVFFGHTVMDDGPLIADSAIGLDTGCVYGGELTAYDVYQNNFVQVSGWDEDS